MSNRSQYDHDMSEGEVTIHEAAETLARKMPTEMIATVLLHEAMDYMEEFRELEQWEAVKEELLVIQDKIIGNVEPHWSNVIDRDKVAELYDKRYG